MVFSIRSSEKCLFSISGQLTLIFFFIKQFSRPLKERGPLQSSYQNWWLLGVADECNHQMTSYQRFKIHWTIRKPQSKTVEPRYNEGPRDWQNLFAITSFRYIERFFSLHFTIAGVKKIVRYTEDFVIYRFVISRFHVLYLTNSSFRSTKRHTESFII